MASDDDPIDERMDPRRRAAYGIVRFDALDDQLPIERRVTVRSVLWTLDRARAEVDRLNNLNGDKGSRYFW